VMDSPHSDPELSQRLRWVSEQGHTPAFVRTVALRIPANDSLLRDIEELLTKPVGRSRHKPVVWYKGFLSRLTPFRRRRLRPPPPRPCAEPGLGVGNFSSCGSSRRPL